jgi:hypothetical protein
MVFKKWAKTCRPNSNVEATKARRKAIRGRLRDGFSVDDLFVAIESAKAALDYGVFDEPDQDRQTDIYQICVDADHVRAWLAYWGSPGIDVVMVTAGFGV